MTQHAVDLVLVLHNHQPHGNFGHVLTQAFEQCYQPLLETLAAFPSVKWAVHHSGPLLEWLEVNQPTYLKDLRSLVKEGQVELLGGGFYEPVLSMLPDRDARGQVEMMEGFCESKLGQTPRGLWLAEHAWDPDLPRVLAGSSVRYTVADESFLLRAGAGASAEGTLGGYYVTEKAGHPLALLPVSRSLRAQCGVVEPQAWVNHLVQSASTLAHPHAAVPVLTWAESGERLGLWSTSADSVLGRGWLRGLLSCLAHDPRVQTRHPGDVLDENAPEDLLYVPAAMPHDTGMNALPPDVADAAQDLLARASTPRARALVQTGTMEMFLARYPESNRLHKRMLQVSAKLDEVVRARGAGALEQSGARVDDRIATAQRYLYAGQCNTAYWCGGSGGLKLNWLRHGVNQCLLKAEAILDDILDGGHPPSVKLEEVDVDADLSTEMVMRNRLVQAVVDPDRGGALWTFDHRPTAFALLDVLARWPEAWHARLPAAEQPPVDHAERLAFVDRFHAREVTAADIAEERARDVGTFSTARYTVVERQANAELMESPSAELTLGARGRITVGQDVHEVVVEKSYLLGSDAAAIQVVYVFSLRGDRSLRCVFAPEVNLTLLAGDAPDRYYDSPDGLVNKPILNTRGVVQGGELSMVDGHYKLRVVLTGDGAVETAYHPVQTAELTQSGVHYRYQGSCIQPVFPLLLVPGRSAVVSLVLGVEEL